MCRRVHLDFIHVKDGSLSWRRRSRCILHLKDERSIESCAIIRLPLASATNISVDAWEGPETTRVVPTAQAERGFSKETLRWKPAATRGLRRFRPFATPWERALNSARERPLTPPAGRPGAGRTRRRAGDCFVSLSPCRRAFCATTSGIMISFSRVAAAIFSVASCPRAPRTS
jgi:hypothetical protein